MTGVRGVLMRERSGWRPSLHPLLSLIQKTKTNVILSESAIPIAIGRRRSEESFFIISKLFFLNELLNKYDLEGTKITIF